MRSCVRVPNARDVIGGRGSGRLVLVVGWADPARCIHRAVHPCPRWLDRRRGSRRRLARVPTARRCVGGRPGPRGARVGGRACPCRRRTDARPHRRQGQGALCHAQPVPPHQPVAGPGLLRPPTMQGSAQRSSPIQRSARATPIPPARTSTPTRGPTRVRITPSTAKEAFSASACVVRSGGSFPRRSQSAPLATSIRAVRVASPPRSARRAAPQPAATGGCRPDRAGRRHRLRLLEGLMQPVSRSLVGGVQDNTDA
jgi:hypothetical protein